MSIRNHFERRTVSRRAALACAAVGEPGRFHETREIWNRFNDSMVAPTGVVSA